MSKEILESILFNNEYSTVSNERIKLSKQIFPFLKFYVRFCLMFEFRYPIVYTVEIDWSLCLIFSKWSSSIRWIAETKLMDMDSNDMKWPIYIYFWKHQPNSNWTPIKRRKFKYFWLSTSIKLLKLCLPNKRVVSWIS